MVRQLHHFKAQFDSVTALRAKLVEELKDDMPDSLSFKVGYYEKPKSKMWIVNTEDIKAMYSKFKHGEIVLWCEGRELDGERKRERRKAF